MLAITGISGLRVPQALDRGFQIQNDLFLSNDDGKIRGLISDGLKSSMGHHEYNFLVNNGYAFYSRELPAVANTEMGDNLLTMWLQVCRLFLHCLWLIRDASAD